MRIGLSTSSIESNRKAIDGIGHYTKQIFHDLQHEGHQVLPLSYNRTWPNKAKLQYPPFPHSYLEYALGAQLTGGRWPKFKHDNIDIMHFTDYKVIPCAMPVVANVWDALIAHPQWIAPKHRWTLKYVLRYMLRFADKVIVPSEHAANEVSDFFRIPLRKISVIPCTISDQWLEKIPKNTLERVLTTYHLSKPYLLTVGTLQPKKNIETLLKAYKKLPKSLREQYSLVIVGKYGWCCHELHHYLLSDKAQQDNVIWLNNVSSDDDLRAIYRAAKLFIFPSLHEGFGIPVLEGFASDTPVITSNLPSLKEVSQGAGLEVNSLKLDELYSAIKLLLDDESLYHQYIKKGQQRLAAFNTPIMLEKICSLYRTLI